MVRSSSYEYVYVFRSHFRLFLLHQILDISISSSDFYTKCLLGENYCRCWEGYFFFLIPTSAKRSSRRIRRFFYWSLMSSHSFVLCCLLSYFADDRIFNSVRLTIWKSRYLHCFKKQKKWKKPRLGIFNAKGLADGRYTGIKIKYLFVEWSWMRISRLLCEIEMQ